MEQTEVTLSVENKIVNIKTWLSPEEVEKLQGKKGWVRLENYENVTHIDGERVTNE